MSTTRRNLLKAAAAITCIQTRKALASQSKKKVTLLHLTDTHAQLETHWEYLPGPKSQIVKMGGFARLKTAIDQQRHSALGPVFAVDGGDLIQGSGPAAWSTGQVMIEPSNALELNVFVPGNWEPVYGPRAFLDIMGQLKAHVSAFNFHDQRSGRRLFEPYIKLEKEGVRVVFVGIADPTTTKRQPPAQVEGLDSTRMDGLREFLQNLRRNERPDLLVAVTHAGLTPSRQIAKENPELDVVLSGHTHERTEKVMREGNVLVVESGSNGSFIGRLDLTLHSSGGIADHQFQLIPIHEADFAEHQGVKDTVNRLLLPHRERQQRRVCTTNVDVLRYDVFETNADNLISDIVQRVGETDLGMTNGFRFAPPIVPGELTEGDLWNLLPLDSRIKRGQISGQQLRNYMEDELELVFSRDPRKLSGGWGPRLAGLNMEFEAKSSPGKRVRSLKVKGKEVVPDAIYSVAGCEREGEPIDLVCRIRNVRNVEFLKPSIHEAMLSSLRHMQVIAPKRESRSRAIDLPDRALSQDALLQKLYSRS
jgi:S-sulfosulfanyl-L-cysteine sulfohydrolase